MLTRRVLLRATASAAAVGASPIIAQAAQPEHPWEKARRLGRELSEVLALDIGDGIGPGGEWFAEIQPASDRAHHCVLFGSIESRNWPRHNVSLPCQKVIEQHRKAWKAYGKAITENDCKEPSKAARSRYAQTSTAEELALIAVCAFRPHGRADAKAKADYLKRFILGRELSGRHLLALVNSAVTA